MKFLPWQIGQPNGAGYQECVAMPLNLTVNGVHKYFYYDVVCKETHCFYCQVCPQLYFILRGLPEQWSKIDDNKEGIDSNYIYVPEFQHMEGIVLEGYYDHTIWMNKQTHNWEIVKKLNTNGSKNSIKLKKWRG